MGSELEAPVGWKWVRLADLTLGNTITYGVVQPGADDPRGVPMIRVNNFTANGLDLSNLAHITPSIEAKYTRTRLRPHDVLITVVGSVGQVAIVPAKATNWNIARAVALVRPADIKLSRWIALCLRSPFSQHSLNVTANTTVQTTVNLKELKQLAIPMPPTREHEEIATTLSALDDRIELLRQTNATLEAIAQALFKSWFVDFDPVLAKAEGREPDGMDAATAALFPDSFEETPFGPIPQGWKARSLDSIASYLNGLALQKFPPESDDEFLPVIKIAQLRAGNTTNADRASARLKPEYVIHDGDVLFSWSGSLEVEFWCGGDGALNQHLFKVTSTEVPKWFYYLATRQHLPMFRQIAASKATTMGHIQRQHLTQAKVAVPPLPVLTAATEIIEPLLDRRISNSLQMRQLSELRDTLLPRLISGKLRLPDVQALIEEATP